MDILQLKHFLSIAETLHFGKSSRRCNLSPSAFTRSIKRLEEELGYPLLNRSNRHAELTPAGTIFRQYASDIIEQLEEFQHSAVLGEKKLKGEISLYCTVTACYSILPGIIRDFRVRYPDIHIKLLTGDAESTLQKVLENEVDVSIAVKPDRLPDSVDFFPMAETPLVFIAPSFDTKFIRADEDTFNPKKCPMILPDKGLARNRVDMWFKNRGVLPDIYAQVAGNEAILAMVNLGCGIGLVPELVVERSPLSESVRILETKPALESYIVGICSQKKRNSNPFVRAFREVALENSSCENRSLEKHQPGEGETPEGAGT